MRHARLLFPDIGGFVVGGDVALVVLETGGVQTVLGQTPHVRQQLPGPGDGFLFVIIAKGPVAQHLEKRVMGVVAADLVQVVVLAGHAQHFCESTARV